MVQASFERPGWAPRHAEQRGRQAGGPRAGSMAWLHAGGTGIPWVAGARKVCVEGTVTLE